MITMMQKSCLVYKTAVGLQCKAHSIPYRLFKHPIRMAPPIYPLKSKYRPLLICPNFRIMSMVMINFIF